MDQPTVIRGLPTRGPSGAWPPRGRRVPLRLQLSAVECGPACLAMILSYHGRHTGVAECRAWFGPGRDGVTAGAIARAARDRGLRTRAFTVEPADLRRVRLPAIAHWQFNHFVVVERWTPARVVVVDPARGRRTLSPDAFDAGCTGVVLTFEPADGFERRAQTSAGGWRRYLAAMARTPGLLAQVVAASLIVQVVGLALPLGVGLVVDLLAPPRLGPALSLVGVGVGLIMLTLLVTSYLRSALLVALQARLDADLMVGFFEHLLRLPIRFFEQRSSGDLLLRLGGNALIRETLTSQLLSVVLDGALALGYLGLLLAWAPLVGLLVLGLGLAQVGIVLAAAPRLQALTSAEVATQADAQGYAVEALSGIATLKAAGAEGRAADHWAGLFAGQLHASVRRNLLAAGVDAAQAALRAGSPLAVLLVGALGVLDGRMSVGTLLASSALAAVALAPLASLVAQCQRLPLVDAHLERIGDVLAAAPEQPSTAGLLAPRLTGRIELDRVGFRYDERAPRVLRDLSLAVEPGQVVAVVGRTGSGKSTLARLLLGLYPPTDGDLRYDGVPLARLDHGSLRRQIGVVLQEPFLFSGSIRRNIAFNDPGLTLDEIVEAASLAAVHDEIARMPMGYETSVGAGGAGLSGGQRQRLALARAVASRPAVLVLDEATSHLDAVTERRIEHNLRQLRCTRIVIAHRLSTIRAADLILVLEDGAVVDRGRHEELLARGGLYAALARHQTDPEATPPTPFDGAAASAPSGSLV